MRRMAGATADVMATDLGKAMIVLSERVAKIEEEIKKLKGKQGDESKDEG